MSDDRLERIERNLNNLTKTIIGDGVDPGLSERVNQLYDDIYGSERGREYSLFAQIARIRDSIDDMGRDTRRARQKLQMQIDELSALFDDSRMKLIGILRQIRAAVIGGVIASILAIAVVAILSGSPEMGQRLWNALESLLTLL